MIRDIAGLMILYDILYIVCFVRQPRFFAAVLLFSCVISIIFVRQLFIFVWQFYYFRASALFYFDG